MEPKVKKIVTEIFYNVQFNKTCHQSNLKKLKKCYEQINLSYFWKYFESCFRVPLSIPRRHPRVENTLEFVAKFAASLYSITDNDVETEEPLCPFLNKLFDFILTNHGAKNPGVRFRICHFLNILLNSMGEHAFMDDDLCDKITVSMMNRLLDKSPKVRAQAIFALHRLQDPADDQCPVIKMYIFHATKDPKSDVRRAALMSMGKNQNTLQVALRRTRDVNESVRKIAYEFISKVTVRSLTITQRDQLLNDGLKDRSEIVRKTAQNVLLPAWLRHFNGNFISLIKALDAEIGTDVAVLSLESLFKSAALNNLIEQLPVDKETKLIPTDQLVSENALYWKCLVKHLQREMCTEELETIIPELSNFCTYISDFLVTMSAQQSEKWVYHTQKFILLQLFEIITTYDLSDEVGRKKLNEVICNTLMSNHCSEQIIEHIVTHLQKVIPDVNSRLDILANIISEIRLPLKETQVHTQISEEQQHEINMHRAKLKVKLLELKEEEYQAIEEKQYLKADSLKNQINSLTEEITKLSKQPDIVTIEEIKEKNDPETMIKCLSIICTMMQSVNALTPTLRSLMQIALDSLDHSDDRVHILAVKAVSICCILDKELAKQHIMTLFLQFSLEQENVEIWIVALKGIFDLLLLYGLEYFDIVENTQENTTNKGEKSRTKLYNNTDSDISLTSVNKTHTEGCNFIKILAGLLDNTNQELRTVAAEGLCKLLLNQRISNSSLLSRLIILCYNPVNDNDFYLRQCLSGFFDNYVTRVPDAQMLLEEAYLPTLGIICNAPEVSPLQEIDPYDISRFILNLSRFGIRKSDTEHYCVHNNIVFTILAEILNPDSSIDKETLVKSLKDLHLEVDDPSKQNIREAMNNVTELVLNYDKRLLKYIELFKNKLDHGAVDVPADEDTEVDE
ncbi:Condensin complex subunit 3 [Habropoda laboriosa]|uniref:Condensin complex subunit 3 n=1 Tax=Habropoda laboriosa TaxID=597456 RepID=A0A0L7QM91_9HYME|nr:PREDICTED: condensin complex subunit 3 [Habropoda laboriosa]KOC59737.1 Condensin complex subunit 3 [Habropoda laboriosa]